MYLFGPTTYLFTNAWQDMIKNIERHPNVFDFDELKVIVDLTHQDSESRSVYNDVMNKLKNHFIRNNLNKA